MSFNLFMCGVGGQGLVLLTSVIGDACARSGLNAVTGEMYGLSQRSGTVSVHMRIGESVFSPLIPYGEADVLMALEAVEAVRYIEYLKENGIVLMNSRIMHPPAETAHLIADKNAKYITLDDVIGRLRKWTRNIAIIDALNLAKDAGNINAENAVFLGCLSTLKAFPLEANILKASIARAVPAKTVEQNLKAYDLGRDAAYRQLCKLVDCRENV
jgi:indolepyruvate ferredoxin oxidoreductase beta subunit